MFSALNAALLAMLFCAFIFGWILELPLDLSKGTLILLVIIYFFKFPSIVIDCGLASCEMTKYRSLPQVGVKMLIGTANIISCIFFFYVLKSTLNTFTTVNFSNHHNIVREKSKIIFVKNT